MTNYAGELLGQSLILAQPALSPNVGCQLFPVMGLSFHDAIAGLFVSEYADDLDALQSAAPRIAYAGEKPGLFNELFEKVIAFPNRKNCGFIAAQVTFTTDVWNTHVNTPRQIESCAVTGSGNTIVNNPAGYPQQLWPLQSHAFETVVPREGDAVINQAIAFDVSGESGVGLIIIGQRIIIFSLEPDWNEPFKEKPQYLTSIITGYSGKEQRVVLRKNPRLALEFQTIAPDGQTAAALESLLYGWQARVFGIPFWPDAQKIAQGSDQGARTIYCNTANRKFHQGGSALLWRDMLTCEAATIESLNTSSITVSAPLNSSWAADGLTYVIPVITGYWSGNALLGGINPSAMELAAAFDCLPQPDVSPATHETVYGYDVLETMPNAAQDRDTKYSRNLRRIESTPGTFKQIDRSGVAIGAPGGFLWTMEGREEIAAFRAWMALRKGRAKAFWLPTWRHDLCQADPLAAGATALIIKPTGYTRFQFPQAARRYIRVAMLDGSGAIYYRRITNAQDNGTDETLTLSSAISATAIMQPGASMISFLQLVRLATDEPEIIFHSHDVAEVQLDFVEVPLEV